MANSVQIVGVGYAGYSRNSPQSVMQLALDAAMAAIHDADVPVEAVDGMCTYQWNDSVSPEEVSTALGLGPLSWWAELFAGGWAACGLVGLAADAIRAERAKCVVLYRAMKGASGVRFGSYAADAECTGREQFFAPYGYGIPIHKYAMACRRHMHAYGTTYEHLGAVAVSQRRFANMNERAVMHDKKLTLDEYLASRFITDPFRLYDCCQETDGAVALVLASSGLTKRSGVQVLASASALPPFASSPYPEYDDMTQMFPVWLRSRLYSEAGLTPSDIDFANLYDAFTFNVICQLEDFGLCEKGAGGEFVASGAIGPGGALPVNTHGGLLSEGYIHGLNATAEAVVQLRGEAGARQVPGAEVGLVSGSSYSRGAALLLGRS
jgi:acetyl-CoA acetyltransferase